VSLLRRKPAAAPVFPAGDLKFYSNVGAQPWFFVPDTGTPGGSAVLIDPSGAQVAAVETQLSPPKPTKPDGSPWVTRWGPRVGFKVPVAFDTTGTWFFVVTQDDVVSTYEIVVRPAPLEEG
jgi:hypothetical protein